MPYQPGRHFLQIPGPTNVPDRILRAIDNPTIDHRSAEFAALATACLEVEDYLPKPRARSLSIPRRGLAPGKRPWSTRFNPGDRVVIFDAGQFASLWSKMATSLSLKETRFRADWRRGADPDALRSKLEEDTQQRNQSRKWWSTTKPPPA